MIAFGNDTWVNLQISAKGGNETASFKLFDAASSSVLTLDTTVTISPAAEVSTFASPTILAFVATVEESSTNRAPVAGAGSAQTVNVGATVTLDGSSQVMLIAIH